MRFRAAQSARAHVRRRVAAARSVGGQRRALSSSPSLPAVLEPLGLKYLEEDALREVFDGLASSHPTTASEPSLRDGEARRLLVSAGISEPSEEDTTHLINEIAPDAGGAITWQHFKAAVDAAALPIDGRVLPISGSLLLNFTGQGIMLPVLPVLARSLGLGPAELGFVTAASAGARLVWGIPAAKIAERIGRRPLLIAGPAVGTLAMCGLAMSTTFEHLILCNALAGVGSAFVVAGAGLYLADISTPRNRAQTNAPLMVSALLGFAVGPALGGVLAESFGLHVPFIACAGGMGLAATAAYLTLPETMRAVSTLRADLRESGTKATAKEAKAEESVTGAAGAGTDSLSRRDSLSASEMGVREEEAALAAATSGAALEPTWRESARATVQSWRGLLDRPQLVGINCAVFMTGFSQGAAPVTGVLFATEHLGMSMSEVSSSRTER